MEELLIRWGFPEMVPSFQAAEMDIEALEAMTEEDMKYFIPLMGRRIKFRRARDNHFSSLETSKPSQKEIYEPSSPPPLTTFDEIYSPEGLYLVCDSKESACSPAKKAKLDQKSTAEASSSSSSLEVLAYEHLSEVSSGSVEVFACEPLHLVAQGEGEKGADVEEARSKEKNPLIKELQDVIFNPRDPDCSFLIKQRPTQKLDGQGRTKLCDIVVKHWMSKSTDFKIARETFLQLRDGIADSFPKEIPETFFVPSKTSKIKGLSKGNQGKLWYKYTKLRSHMLQAKLVQKTTSAEEANASSEEDCEKELEWLKNWTEPWDKVCEYWRKTSSSRLRELQRLEEDVSKDIEQKTVFSYLRTYPALLSPTGYELLEQDFDCLFPDRTFNLFDSWEDFSKKLITYLSEKSLPNTSPLRPLLNIINRPDIRNDQKVVAILHCIPALLHQHTTRQKGKSKKQWRPSLLESQQGFIHHVKAVSAIEPSLEARREKLRQFHLRSQPLVVVVGTDLTNISTSYVSVDKWLYRITSPLKALDVCFKLHHALHAEYSPECEATWFFLQKAVYKISTEWDKPIIAVNALLTDLQ